MIRLGLFVALDAGLGLSACGAGQVFGATLTPTPTETRTPTPTITSTFTPSSTPTSTPTPTPVVYDIFKPESFPPEMLAVYKDPTNATPEQQAAYQIFLDEQRAAFFKKAGIDKDVQAMIDSGKIYPEQAGLWGMALWESMQATPGEFVVGPGDAKTAYSVDFPNVDIPVLDRWYDQRIIDGGNRAFAFGYGGNQIRICRLLH